MTFGGGELGDGWEVECGGFRWEGRRLARVMEGSRQGKGVAEAARDTGYELVQAPTTWVE
jgi:hypothetical protein